MQIDWWRGVGAGSLCAIIWSLQSVVTRQAIADKLTAADVTIVQFLVSGLILSPIALRLRPPLVGRLGWHRALALSLLAGAPYSLLLVGGLSLSPAVHQAVITPGLIPIFAAVLSFPVSGERLSATKGLGLTLVAIGIVAFFRDSLSVLPTRAGAWRGDILFVVAAAMWATFGLLSQRWNADPIETTACTCVLSFVSIPLWVCLLPLQITQVALAAIALQGVYQGVLVGALSLFLYVRAVEFLGSASAALFLPLMPLVAAIGAYVFLGEQPTSLEIAGMIAVVVGMTVALRAPH